MESNSFFLKVEARKFKTSVREYCEVLTEIKKKDRATGERGIHKKGVLENIQEKRKTCIYLVNTITELILSIDLSDMIDEDKSKDKSKEIEELTENLQEVLTSYKNLINEVHLTFTEVPIRKYTPTREDRIHMLNLLRFESSNDNTSSLNVDECLRL